jgi:dihydropyrimidinase
MPGADADLVIVDPKVEKTFKADELPSGSEFTVYEGIKAKGWPSVVMSRGRIIVSDGVLQKAAGHGRYLPRRH